MLNAIKSIEPYWGEDNIPPRPREVKRMVFNNKTKLATDVVINQEELDEWDRIFGGKVKLLTEKSKNLLS